MQGPLVDFGDPDSILAAIPQVQVLIREAEGEITLAIEEAQRASERASDAELEIQRLKAILLTLEGLNAEPAAPDGKEQGSSKDRALWIVIATNGPTNIPEVHEHMDEFSRNTVSWALWKLAEEGVIQRIDQGRYAPPDYVPGRHTTNYLKLPPGFPAPSRAQIDHAVEEARAKARPR